jgi:hypothetical protein
MTLPLQTQSNGQARRAIHIHFLQFYIRLYFLSHKVRAGVVVIVKWHAHYKWPDLSFPEFTVCIYFVLI